MATGLLESNTVLVGTTLDTNSARRARPTGEAAATLLAVVIGMLTLAVVNQFTAISPGFNTWVYAVGKLWMPGAEGIGPYSGKETLSVIAWLGSWGVLHSMLRARELPLSRCLIVFLVGVGVATTFIWPPVFEYFVAH
jgi:hypothetical protein